MRDARRGHDVTMRWDNLLFLHWPVDPAVMRPLIPEHLELDLFDGKAWIALVPFRMEATRFRGFPELPGLSSFSECNVRTYVTPRGSDDPTKAGVWFFSLDAERLIPVLGGNWLWSLNYIHSRFNVQQAESEGERLTDYRLARRSRPNERTHIVWTRGDELPTAQPGCIEHFLTERYWLYTIRRNRLMGGRIHHNPWPLRSARVEKVDDTLITSAGIEIQGDPLAWHSDSIEVVGWNLQHIDDRTTA